MNTTLWIFQYTLAFLTGVMGIFRILVRSDGSYSPVRNRVMGGIGVVLAIGLILPAFTDAFPLAVPISASLLFCLQVIGIVMTKKEDRKKEYAVINFFILLITAFVIYGRYFYTK
jgi:hypothetical protein